MPGYADLKAEIDSDPLGLSYAGKTDAQVANLLNGEDRAVQTPRSVVAASLVFEAIVPGEWASLTAQEKQRVQTILGMGEVDLSGPNTRASLAAAFGAGTTTRANLLALQTLSTPRSRAVEIFGYPVTAADVAAARSLS
jgi:hypothetical protein